MLTKITDADYPGWSTVTPTSITAPGSTATVTAAGRRQLAIRIDSDHRGRPQKLEYNGDFVISVTDPTHFDYEVTGTPTTPATGTITATGGRTTVPGSSISMGTSS